jgi:hypothetical protein
LLETRTGEAALDACMHACMYVCKEPRIHTCIHTHAYTHLHTYIHHSTFKNTSSAIEVVMKNDRAGIVHDESRTSRDKRLYTVESGMYTCCLHTYIHTYIHSYMHACMHIKKCASLFKDILMFPRRYLLSLVSLCNHRIFFECKFVSVFVLVYIRMGLPCA